MTVVEVLLTEPYLPRIGDALTSPFRVHSLEPAADLGAVPAAVAGTVRGIACGTETLVNGQTLDLFPNLEIVANFGVGYDNIDASEAGRRGIVVTNTPDVLTEEVADTAIGLTIMTVRELSAAERWLRAGNWQAGYPLTRGTLRDKTMGIFGLGRIGKAIAKRAEAKGLDILYHNRNIDPEVSYTYCSSPLELAERSDILMCVAPGGPSTQGVVDRAVLQALGPEGVLINIGRGSVVDQSALIDALRDGTIRSAGLDVFWDEPHVPEELIAMDHVVLLPHVGSASVHTRDAMGQLQADNLIHWFSKGAPLTPVRETPWPRP